MGESCDFLLIAHRWYQPDGKVKFGGIDRTKDHLLSNGSRLGLVEHPLTTVDVNYILPSESRLSILSGEERTELQEFIVRPTGNPWRWLAESGQTVKVVTEHMERGFVSISADPLAGLTGLKLKAAGFAKASVLHFTDYADKRTGNPLLNAAYRWLTKRNLAKSDLVLCVSKRMISRFEKLCPSGNYMHFANTPSVSECPRTAVTERDRSRVVLMGVDAAGMQHDILIDGLAAARAELLTLKLDIIGGGGGEKILMDLAGKAGIADAVTSHGFISRSEALDLVSKSGVGIVLYDPSIPWNHYRDSLKIREYAGCGLPVIADDSTATAQEASDAGCAELVSSAEELATVLKKLLTDDAVYSDMSESASRWAESNDKRLFLKDLTTRIQDLRSE